MLQLGDKLILAPEQVSNPREGVPRREEGAKLFYLRIVDFTFSVLDYDHLGPLDRIVSST